MNEWVWIKNADGKIFYYFKVSRVIRLFSETNDENKTVILFEGGQTDIVDISLDKLKEAMINKDAY